MLKVKNKRILRKLSVRILSTKKSKNLISLAAILLTTILFTTVFSIGGNIIQGSTEATLRQVGGNTHAGFKNFTMAEYEQMKDDPAIRDVSYNIVVGSAVNPKFNKLVCEVRYFEPLDAQHSFSYPTTGSMPQNKEEAAMSTLVLDALGIPHKLGEEITLEINVHGKTRTDTFVLCGFWEGDPIAMAQEILVSKDYCLEAAPLETTPFCETDGMDYSGYMNVNFNFSNSFNIEGKMDDLIERCGFDPARVDPAVNWGYGFSSVDPTSLTLIVVLLLLIMLSGYLIIYNIFYLNIFSDIRFYGLLKTVGTTGKQLRKLVRRQAWALCLFGVPAGLVIGWIIGRFLTPVVIGMLNQVTPTYSLNPLVFIGSALFTIITVYISCIKPCRIAAKVSPVEAARYTEKKKKKRTKKTKRATPFFMALSNMGRSTRKLVLVILSLSLSVILLNSVYTIVTGFDMDKFIASYLLSDCVVSDVSIYNNMLGYRNTHGVTKDFQQELSARDDITEIGNIYVQPVLYTWSDEEWADIERFMNAPEMQDTVNDPIMKDVYDEIRSARQSQLYVYGVDEMAAGLISLKEGTLDWKKFSSGNYVIVNAWNSSEADGNFDRPFLEPGDKVTPDFEQGGAKEYEVMAVGQLPSALSMQASTLIGEEFILPDAAWIKDYCENVNPDMTCRTRADYEDEFRGLQRMYALVGGLLSFILALIGILNFVNVTATSILSRRQELAMLESIGMTGTQQRRMLQYEGLCYAALTILISCTAGIWFGRLLVQAIAGQMWMFSWHFTVLPIVICTPFLFALSLVVPVLCYQSARKKSVVERLRISED